MTGGPASTRERWGRRLVRVVGMAPTEVDLFGALRHYGVSETVIQRANGAVLRVARATYMMTMLGTLAIAVGGLLSIRHNTVPGGAAANLALLTVAVLLLVQVGKGLVRRTFPHAVLISIGQAVRTLAATQRRNDESAGAQRRRRAARDILRNESWRLAADLAGAAGHGRRARDTPKTALLSRWLCWASEDLDNPRRTDAALHACADAVVQIVGPLQRVPPSIAYPPSTAVLLRPVRSQRIAGYLRNLRELLLPIIPIVAAAIGLLAKVWI